MLKHSMFSHSKKKSDCLKIAQLLIWSHNKDRLQHIYYTINVLMLIINKELFFLNTWE